MTMLVNLDTVTAARASDAEQISALAALADERREACEMALAYLSSAALRRTVEANATGRAVLARLGKPSK